MDMNLIQSRIDENKEKLTTLEAAKRSLIAANHVTISSILRDRVASYVASIEDDVASEVCGKELLDILSQIKRVKEDLSIFESFVH